jgi:hypothetical protein
MAFFDDMSIRLSFFPDLPLLLSLLPLLVIRRVTVLTWASEEGDDPRCIICLITRREDDHHFLERQRTTIGRYVIIQLRYFSLLSNKNICPLFFFSLLFLYICYVIFLNQSSSARRCVQHTYIRIRQCLFMERTEIVWR